jgi:tRNA wybutosine-synthesizing protein 3
MLQDKFLKRKQDILSKIDKSFKNKWDKRIFKLCQKINFLENYYTTSSCSGRIVLMIDQDKKKKGLFIKIYHDLISFNQLKKDLNKIIKKSKKSIKFKMESCILHVACKTLEDAQVLHDKAKLAGWKRSGIIASGKRFIIELNSTEKLEFPIIKNSKILVNDEFLKIIIRESNRKLNKSWGKIEGLRKLLEDNSYSKSPKYI